ncbi:MAG: hypothetical protein JKX85_09125 [Phycisphaeraceae bacterium]|nr:hypothetical protein [Phycisphaeraceae bacterium]
MAEKPQATYNKSMTDTQPKTDTDTPLSATDESPSLHGTVLECASSDNADQVVAQAVDYRGDVTLELLDGQKVQGYVFDRRAQDNPPIARMWPKGSEQLFVVPYSQIAKIHFAGKDAAVGKSWETWVKKHAEKTAKGEKAEMLPDSLDDD